MIQVALIAVRIASLAFFFETGRSQEGAKKEPGGTRRSQEGARRSQEGPGSQEEPGGARREPDAYETASRQDCLTKV